MLKSGKLALVAWLVTVVTLAYGLGALFKMRLAQGDIYPPYSSLRADPLGSKAFFASLDNLTGLSARRNLEPFHKLRDPRGVTFMYLASPVIEQWDEPNRASFEAIASQGGRLVVTFYPVIRKPAPKESLFPDASNQPQSGKPAPGKPKPSPKKKQPAPAQTETEAVFGWPKVLERWGVGLAYADVKLGADGVPEPMVAERKDTTNDTTRCSWHSALYFDNLTNAWRVAYARGSQPVVIERPWGLGSIVLASDSYFASNEALRVERHSGLLAWLVGSNAKVVFDEIHLGVEERPGLASLARKYRLHGVLAGLLVLAALFVWQNSVSLVPPYRETTGAAEEEWVAGRDSTAGFINLLRRSIAARDVLATCLAEWKKSRGRAPASAPDRRRLAEAIVNTAQARPVRERELVAAYRQVCEVLKSKV